MQNHTRTDFTDTRKIFYGFLVLPSRRRNVCLDGLQCNNACLITGVHFCVLNGYGQSKKRKSWMFMTGALHLPDRLFRRRCLYRSILVCRREFGRRGNPHGYEYQDTTRLAFRSDCTGFGNHPKFCGLYGRRYLRQRPPLDSPHVCCVFLWKISGLACSAYLASMLHNPQPGISHMMTVIYIWKYYQYYSPTISCLEFIPLPPGQALCQPVAVPSIQNILLKASWLAGKNACY